jgi:MYXO-CTERM domain-containing protein
MNRAHVLIGVLLLTASGFAQQPGTTRNPSLNPDAYTRDTYNRPVQYRTGSGNWGLLGLFGLLGLSGLRRRDTMVRGRDEFISEQRRRVA